MNKANISLNMSDASSIESHLRECEGRFSPSLSARVDLGDYARKLASLADRMEAWRGIRLVGLVAAYLNTPEAGRGFVSNVSVSADVEGTGLASELLLMCMQLARDKGCEALELEVGASDERTKTFYLRHGFALTGEGRNGFLRMKCQLSDK